MNEILGSEAALRRALHAAAEQVDPGDDGLDRIRARVRHRRPMPLPIAWVDIALTKLSLRVPDGFWVIWDRVAREVRAVTDQFLPERLRSERRRLGWLRPVAAMSVAVFLVAAVVSMAIEVPQVISPAGSATNQTNTGTQQHTGGNGGPGGQPQAKSGANPSNSPAPVVSGPSSSPCRSKTPAPMITSSPPPATPPQQSPSPTPSDTSTPTPTPTPTPSASLSSGPTAADISGSTADAGGTGLAAASANAANSGTAAGSNALRTTATKPHASPTPCSSKSPSPSSAARSQALGAVPWSLTTVLSPADLRART